ncbi:MAG: DUF3126 family protein [Alphaproteobacteria bacterium]|nr:DUF3126 family protein [Alphaproteobacteria bacterium]
MTLTETEINKIQQYLRQLFWNPDITLRPGTAKDSPAEVYIGKEFIGVIYKNDDEGEISFDWNMSILNDDIEQF